VTNQGRSTQVHDFSPLLRNQQLARTSTTKRPKEEDRRALDDLRGGRPTYGASAGARRPRAEATESAPELDYNALCMGNFGR
jgi:hypothetical protein